MNLSNRDTHLSIAVTLLITLSHLALIHLPSVNHEFAFISAATFFSTHQQSDLNIYLTYQANTLLTPFLMHLTHTLLPFLEMQTATRLCSIAGTPIFSYALYLLLKKIPHSMPTWAVIGLVLSNPLIWVFSGRGTADILPASVGLLSIALLFSKENLRPLFLLRCGAIMSIAITLKYHAAFLMIGFAFVIMSASDLSMRTRFIKLALISFVSLALPIAYIIMIKTHLGFWLAPPTFQETHHLNLPSAFLNFSGYGTYLIALLAPFSLIACAERITKNTILYFLTATPLVAALLTLVPHVSGELNFGALDALLPSYFLDALSACGAIMFLFIITTFVKEKHPTSLSSYHALAILVVIVMLSFSRPAQRYLIFVLPLFYVVLFTHIESKTMLRICAALSIIFYLTLNGISVAHQMATGAAAAEITSQLREKNLLSATIPSAIEAHTGMEFFPYRSEKKSYIVVNGNAPNAVLHTERRYLHFFKREYSVIPQ